MNKTKLWKVKDDSLSEMTSSSLDLEERIHKWVEKDLSIILPNAILVGSKIKTDHGKELDLLAIDENGDLVVIELKRGLTPREVTSQALDYASWVATLTIDDIDKILTNRGESRSVLELLSDAFDNNDDIDINEGQKIYIVASAIDSITERICRYLSTNGLQINVVTFNYYKDTDNEYIARNFLVSEMDSPKDTVKKRSGRFTTKLFNEGKLEIGQKVRYLPASEKGVEVVAEIFRVGSKCLRLPDSDEKYSFSSLRAKIIKENDLSLNPHFPYAQWGEWELIDKDAKLSEL